MSASIFGIKTRSGLQNDLFCLQEERDYFQTKYLEQVSEIHALKEQLSKSKKEITRLRLSVMNNDNTMSMPPDHITATPKNSNGCNRVALTASCSDSYDDDQLDNENDSQEHIAKKDDASSLTAEEIEELLTDEDDDPAAVAVYRTPSKSKKKNRSPHNDDNDNDNGNNENEEEVDDVRKSAEKLLQWASYRSRTSNSQRSTSLSRNADGTESPSPSVFTSTNNSVARQPSLLGKMIDTMDDDDDDDDDDNDDANDLSGYHDDDNIDDNDNNKHVVVEQEQKQEEQQTDDP